MSHLDLGTLRGLIAAVLFVAFVALWLSTFSRSRRAELERAARIPLDEEDVSAGGAS